MAISGGDGSIILTTKVDETGLKKGLGSMKKLGAIAGKAFLAIGAAAVTATVAITKMAVSAYADYEQLVGGVETLFKDSAKKVIDYANDAFYTAGISANEYMKQVTSFSASLIRSTAGDTDKAADIANMALIDISDNVNKMGSSMESVTLAYQGFAKQQYMLLDNLKLGYGGTKTEMERLLKDAQALTGIKYDINNLADVYSAIHVIQEELGITGTTAKEAEKTITGSANMMKAAWQNVLSAIAGGGDLDRAINNLVYSIQKYFENIVPVVQRSLVGIGQLIEKVAPLLVQNVASALIQAIPNLLNAIYQMIIGLAKGIWEGIKALFSGKQGSVTSELNTTVGGISTSTEQATDGVKDLGTATEKTAKKIRKSLAVFDDIQIITSDIADNTSSASNAMNDLGVSGGISGLGNVGLNVGSDLNIQTEDVENTSWLGERLSELASAFSGLKSIDLANLSESFDKLLQPLQDLANLAWDTLLWGVKNVITPITSMVVETVLPGFFNLLGEALAILKDVLEGALDLFKDFYDTFVLPIVSVVVNDALPVFFDILSGALQILKTVLDTGLDLFKDFYEKFVKPVGSHIGEKFVEFWGELNPKMEGFSNLFKNSSLWNDIVTIWQKLKDVFGFLSEILTPIVNGLVDVAFEIAKPLALLSYIELEGTFKGIEDAVGAVASLLEGDFKGAWEHTKEYLVTNHIETAKEKVELVKDVFVDLKGKIEEAMSMWGEAWENISVWYEEDVEPWFDVEKWVELFGNIIIAVNRFFGDEDGMFQTWTENFEIWWDEHVSPWFTQEKWDITFSVVHTSLEDMMYKSGGFFATWDTAINDWWNNKVLPAFSKEKWESIWDTVKQTFSDVWNDQDGIVYIWRTKINDWWNNDVKTFFSEYEWQNLGRDLINGLWKGIKSLPGLLVGLVNGCLDALQSLANGVIDLINSFIDGYNNVADGVLVKKKDRIDKIDLTKYHISLPKLAQGAVIPPNREFLAVLGDQKYGTNIEAPLQTIVDAFNIALQGNANYGGGNTEVILEIDGREFGRAVVEQGNRENRRIGTRLVMA